MQLAKIEVKGLFKLYDHAVEFPTTVEPRNASDNDSELEQNAEPSILIIYGPNGVGKTTILKMLHDILKLDFNIFREIPFSAFSVTFNQGSKITVSSKSDSKNLSGLEVIYARHKVMLHPHKSGALLANETEKVRLFRQKFLKDTESLDFLFIDTKRFLNQFENNKNKTISLSQFKNAATYIDSENYQMDLFNGIDSAATINPKSLAKAKPGLMAERVIRFINEAQANYRHFFSNTQPDIFEKVLESLSKLSHTNYTHAELSNRLKTIIKRDQQAKRLGLEPDIRNSVELLNLIEVNEKKEDSGYFLTTLGAYVDLLESRSNERTLLARRLFKFEELLNDFFKNKTITISAKQGFTIVDSVGKSLREEQLSSGEYHLLYLLVSSLVVKRRGTVIAIDEPEISMHIAWQRKLVKALFECAAGAEPQFVFATHSPDVSGEYSEKMTELTSNIIKK